MSSLIKLIRTNNGRKLINLAKVSSINVEDRTIEYTFDCKKSQWSTVAAKYDTPESAKIAFDEIYTDLATYYKIKDKD